MNTLVFFYIISGKLTSQQVNAFIWTVSQGDNNELLQIRGPHMTLSPDIGVMGHQVAQSFVFTLSSGLGNVKNIDGLWW